MRSAPNGPPDDDKPPAATLILLVVLFVALTWLFLVVPLVR